MILALIDGRGRTSAYVEYTGQAASQQRLRVFCSLRLHGCPCGYYGDPVKECSCTPMMVSKYQKRISGPLLDRIDIFVDVPRIDYEKLADDRVGEKAESVRARVEKAREIQRQRLAGTKLTCNNEMTPVEVRQFCPVDAAAQSLLRAAMKQMSLSARAFHRVLKLSRTIADLSAGSGQALAGAEQIQSALLAEAIQYRPRSLV